MPRSKGSINRNESVYRKFERLVNEGLTYEQARNQLVEEGSNRATLIVYEYRLKKESGQPQVQQ